MCSYIPNNWRTILQLSPCTRIITLFVFSHFIIYLHRDYIILFHCSAIIRFCCLYIYCFIIYIYIYIYTYYIYICVSLCHGWCTKPPHVCWFKLSYVFLGVWRSIAMSYTMIILVKLRFMVGKVGKCPPCASCCSCPSAHVKWRNMLVIYI